MTTSSTETRVACRSCGSDQAQPYARDMLHCSKCQLVYSVHRYNARIYEQREKLDEWAYRAGTDLARRIAMFRLGLLAVHLRRGSRILDIGCGTGDFVAGAIRAGYDAVGFEPALGMRGIARRNVSETYGLDPALTIREALPLGRWDAITMWDVVEHLEKPREDLARTANMLEPGGLLALITPDLEATCASTVEAWRHYKPREHLVLFRSGTLRPLLKRAGLKVLSQGWDESWARPDEGRRNLLHMVARKER